MTPNKLPPLPEHWSVEVRANGEGVLTIESNCLSGRDLSESDERTIENCAQHLLAFLGRRTEALRQSQSLPAGAVDWVAVPREPTDAMLDALRSSEYYCENCHGIGFNAESGYSKMLDAATKEQN